ncbi:MAG: NAD(P)H-dependent oxidoreductase subunit E, partial [Acidobacteriia bacterium]|nr:NAD(P)H-dependent oxidoreductase subunit E [Terriglobia bacterium]
MRRPTTRPPVWFAGAENTLKSTSFMTSVSSVSLSVTRRSAKPRGRYNVQVCRNICCMLRGSDEISAHVKQRLGIPHKGTTADGMFSFEEVECIGACSWAPAMQVNYDFHEKLT